MDSHLKNKYDRLIDILSVYGKAAVAYSGGVDSTLMALAASEALGTGQVVAVHAASCFLATGTSRAARNLIEKELGGRVEYRELQLSPLREPKIELNRQDRCYHCKRYIYEEIFREISNMGISVLLDGTNMDDLQQHRPGFAAIRELGVKTPYLEAGFTKDDIRQTAKWAGLSNFNLPSNSCLATRVEQGVPITHRDLGRIDSMERFLMDNGYEGVRVKIRGEIVIIELRETDLTRFASDERRKEIISFFQQYGYKRVVVDLELR